MMNRFLCQNRLPHLILNRLEGTCTQLQSLNPTRLLNNSAAYDGDGKTTVRVLNNEEANLNLINTYSDRGFRLANNLFIVGSILLFPTHVYSWRVKRGIDINLESLIVFDLIVPKTKIIVIGYGQEGEPYDSSIPLKLKKKGITCEMLATPNAVTTYNYLVHDGVHVAGAFVPMKDVVQMRTKDYQGLYEKGMMDGERDYMEKREYPEESQSFDDMRKWGKEQNRDKGKKTFDE